MRVKGDKIEGQEHADLRTEYYSRTYKHLSPNRMLSFLHYILFLIPGTYLLYANYSDITKTFANLAYRIISNLIPAELLGIGQDAYFPHKGDVYYLTLPTNAAPSTGFIIVNIIVIALIYFILTKTKDRFKPIGYYLGVGLFIHLCSCIFFLFFSEYFPYDINEYSSLYIKQQTGIYFSFFIITSLIMADMVTKIFHKYMTMIFIMIYCFVFGFVRYVVFLLILHYFSSLYMAEIFFMLGIFFDFTYLVNFYSIYMSYVSKHIANRQTTNFWKWS